MSLFYTPPPQVVDGTTAFARDVNDINNETNSAFFLAEAALAALEPTVEQWAIRAKAWAEGPGEPPVPTTPVEPGLFAARYWADNAEDSADNASVSESNAALSAAAAALSEGNAATSESNAASSASAANTSAFNAANSETNAAASESAAALSEGNAASSESNAATSASQAFTSASNAAVSEGNAATSESNAASSASSAAGSASSASSSASSASTSASNAATSETNAAASALTATTAAGQAEDARDDILALDLVPSTRTLSATSPIRIAGGGSADLSANRTISILNASTSQRGSVELATSSQTITGTSSTLATTPAGVKAAIVDLIGRSQIGTRTSTGTWTLSGLTIGRPLLLTINRTESSSTGGGIFRYRVTSGSNDAKSASTGRWYTLNDTSTGTGGAASVTIRPTATSVSILIDQLDNSQIRAYH